MSDCRIYTENMSAAPRITRHPKDKGTKVDRQKPIVERTKTTTAPSIFRTTSCFSGRNENHSAVTHAPIAGAATRCPSHCGPTCRKSRDNTGNTAHAPTQHTANSNTVNVTTTTH